MPTQYKKYTDEKQDGRRKLLTEQHEAVRKYYFQVKSQRATASYFGVSRRLIIFILYPERLKALAEKQKADKHWAKYYDRAEHTKAIRKYRNKKQLAGLTYNKN